MWNVIYSNRIMDRRMKIEAHQKHLNTLRNVRSTLDNTAPKKFQFLNSRPKAKLTEFCTSQIDLERQRRIESNNTLLVEKMLSAQSTIKAKDTVYFKDSLNHNFNLKKERAINIDNQTFVKRLQNTTSQYSQAQTWKSSRKYMEFKSKMANSRMDPCYDFQQPRKAHDRPVSAK